MGRTKDKREAAPELFVILDARDKLEALNERKPGVKEHLNKAYQLLVKKTRNYENYPEMVRAGIDCYSWDKSQNPYSREYYCLWCGTRWVLESRSSHQWHCPNSCNIFTE